VASALSVQMSAPESGGDGPKFELTRAAGPARDVIADQWRAFIAALAVAKGPTWVSEPTNIRAAEEKAHQLREARSVGFSVPETLLTNDSDEARAFVDRWHGVAVVKSVASAWWEDAGQARFVYASLVTLDDLPTPERLASAPVCLQQPISPKRDVRVSVVDGTAFAAVRDISVNDPEQPIDWRRARDQPWSAYPLPDEIARACCALVKRLRLRFSGIDLVLDGEGQFWFLELNPNGEWGWLQRAGLPIAEALADTLLSRPR
jgi:glutathione synthase/RimK-type ligase-like ATP-grasp enzyme